MGTTIAVKLQEHKWVWRTWKDQILFISTLEIRPLMDSLIRSYVCILSVNFYTWAWTQRTTTSRKKVHILRWNRYTMICHSRTKYFRRNLFPNTKKSCNRRIGWSAEKKKRKDHKEKYIQKNQEGKNPLHAKGSDPVGIQKWNGSVSFTRFMFASQ